MPVYLIHLHKKMSHAQHYMGATADVKARMERHRAGRGSAMLRAAIARGIRFSLVRTWPGRWEKEKLLKKWRSKELCPACSGHAAMKRGR